MTEPVGPVDRTTRPRRVSRRSGVAGRRASDRAAQAPVKVPADEPAPPPPAGAAAYAAQLMGQGGQKRGLRGGPETIEHAQSAYLETEWSGPADRRLRKGRIAKTEI